MPIKRPSILWSHCQGRRSLVRCELLAQGRVLEGEVAAEETWQEATQVEVVGDHEPRLWPDGPADRSLGFRVRS